MADNFEITTQRQLIAATLAAPIIANAGIKDVKQALIVAGTVFRALYPQPLPTSGLQGGHTVGNGFPAFGDEDNGASTDGGVIIGGGLIADHPRKKAAGKAGKSKR